MTAESLNHSKGYTPDHIHRVVEWFCDNSISIQPDQTAEMVKTAFKKVFGCMTKGCVTHAQTALDVDHVNPAYKAETFAQLSEKTTATVAQPFSVAPMCAGSYWGRRYYACHAIAARILWIDNNICHNCHCLLYNSAASTIAFIAKCRRCDADVKMGGCVRR